MKSTGLIMNITAGFAALILSLMPLTAVWAGDTIHDDYKHAYSESAGWLNFKPLHGGVTVHADYLSGYAWSEGIGYVKLGNDNGGPYENNSPSNWGVNRAADGRLSGYAWSENAGWLNFNPSHHQAVIEIYGHFDGYVWSEGAGWVHLKGDSYGVRAVTDSTDHGSGSGGCFLIAIP